MKTTFLMLSIILMISCRGNEGSSNLEPEENGKFFKLNLPEGWTSTPLQGVDTSVGYFTNKTDTIWYDHGSLAFQDINSSISFFGGKIINQEEKNNKKSVYYLLDNDGKPNSIHGYFKGKNDCQITHLHSYNLLNEKSILTIMKSHSFADFK